MLAGNFGRKAEEDSPAELSETADGSSQVRKCSGLKALEAGFEDFAPTNSCTQIF